MRPTTARMLASEDYSAVPLKPEGCLEPYRPGAPYSLFASPLTLTDSFSSESLFSPGVLQRKGDLVVALRAPIEEAVVGLNVSFHGLVLGDLLFESRDVSVKPRRWAFPWTTDEGDPAVLQLICSNYVSPRLVPHPDSFAGRIEVIYCCLLDCEERKSTATSNNLVRCVAPGRRSAAATSIQRRWRTCMSDPTFSICRRRMLREMDELTAEGAIFF